MVYNFAFLVMAAAIFFGGPTFWPNKKTRMLYSYVAFLVALAGAALVRTLSCPPGRRIWRRRATWKNLGVGSGSFTCARLISLTKKEGVHIHPHIEWYGSAPLKLMHALWPVQVEGVVNQAALPGREYAFSVWVAASAAAGAADALAGSVLNGEAAACKCNYVS